MVDKYTQQLLKSYEEVPTDIETAQDSDESRSFFITVVLTIVIKLILSYLQRVSESDIQPKVAANLTE